MRLFFRALSESPKKFGFWTWWPVTLTSYKRQEMFLFSKLQTKNYRNVVHRRKVLVLTIRRIFWCIAPTTMMSGVLYCHLWVIELYWLMWKTQKNNYLYRQSSWQITRNTISTNELFSIFRSFPTFNKHDRVRTCIKSLSKMPPFQ